MSNSYISFGRLCKIFFFAPVFLIVYFLFTPRNLNIAYYFDILDQQDKDRGFTASEGEIEYDLKILDACKTTYVGHLSEDCYKNFFEKYTKKNGPQKGLEYLRYLMQSEPTVIPGCHYISHGIGAGSLIYYGGDVPKAYSFDVNKIFSNLGSCANGYYHGVAIGLSKKVKSDEEFYETFSKFCKKVDLRTDLGRNSCNHGLGHAITQFFKYDLEKSFGMCKKIYSNENFGGYFGCLTGVRMEYGMYLDYTGLSTEKGINGIKNLCKQYPAGTDEKEACVVEGSGVVRYGEDYIDAVKSCQTLETATERKACTKLMVIHAIRLGRSEQVLQLCKIPLAINEQIECTAFFANYLAISVDINRSKKFFETTSDVCHTLSFIYYPKCIAENFTPDYMTFRSKRDRGIFPTIGELVYIYEFYKDYYKGCIKCENLGEKTNFNIMGDM